MSEAFIEHLNFRKQLRQSKIIANIISFLILTAIIAIDIIRVKGV